MESICFTTAEHEREFPVINPWTGSGIFEIKSGVILASDPSYRKGSSCQASVRNVKNGDWFAFADLLTGEWGESVIRLRAYHTCFDPALGYAACAIRGCASESGQFGFFDYMAFGESWQFPKVCYGKPGKDGIRYTDRDIFLRFCRGLLKNGNRFGLIPMGVSTSVAVQRGGLYDGYAIREEDGSCVGVEVEFAAELEDGF